MLSIQIYTIFHLFSFPSNFCPKMPQVFSKQNILYSFQFWSNFLLPCRCHVLFKPTCTIFQRCVIKTHVPNYWWLHYHQFKCVSKLQIFFQNNQLRLFLFLLPEIDWCFCAINIHFKVCAIEDDTKCCSGCVFQPSKSMIYWWRCTHIQVETEC